MDYSKHFLPNQTPQNEKVPGIKKQAYNNAGGVSFKISKWDYLTRFLILGAEGGTYYVDEKKLTRDACKNTQKCIDKNGKRTIDIAVEISVSGRAANNDAAIFVLAMAASCNNPNTRAYALSKLTEVCRIGTHLFHFMKFIKPMRGFGRGLRRALVNWYISKPIDQLAYQILKYQNRDGWAHQDVIRLAHPIPTNKQMGKLFAYVCGSRNTIPEVSDYAIGMEKIKCAKYSEDAARLIREYNLTREAIPTSFLNSINIWEALLDRMPMTALIRNLGKMASLNMHQAFGNSLNDTCLKLTDTEIIKKSRVHPIQIMNALITYQKGHGFRGDLKWNPSGKIIDALEECFYKSFDNVKPTGKNILLALDVSGSMCGPLNNSLMSCRVASAVLAMVTMRTEENTAIVGFTGEGGCSYKNRGRESWQVISEISLSPRQRLDDVVQSISGLSFGQTNCSLPFLYAIERGYDVDAVVIYTDSETWSGNIHPWKALDKYKQKVGHEVKSIVVGMTATEFSIARSDYPNMLDVIGMDTNTPSVISEFIAQE